MTVDEVMRYRRRKPFQPFVLELNSGREFVVRDPFNIGRDPANRWLGVSAGPGAVALVAIADVRSIRLHGGQSGTGAA